MSKAKHTQGKWEVKSGKICCAVYSNGVQLAFLAGAREEHLANARLIAEAPAMLEMLQEIADKFDKDQHLLNVSPTKIKELIKKIEG